MPLPGLQQFDGSALHPSVCQNAPDLDLSKEQRFGRVPVSVTMTARSRSTSICAVPADGIK
jgi:hypothetical protein